LAGNPCLASTRLDEAQRASAANRGGLPPPPREFSIGAT
jgi:hypothetical protein